MFYIEDVKIGEKVAVVIDNRVVFATLVSLNKPYVRVAILDNSNKIKDVKVENVVRVSSDLEYLLMGYDNCVFRLDLVRSLDLLVDKSMTRLEEICKSAKSDLLDYINHNKYSFKQSDIEHKYIEDLKKGDTVLYYNNDTLIPVAFIGSNEYGVSVKVKTLGVVLDEVSIDSLYQLNTECLDIMKRISVINGEVEALNISESFDDVDKLRVGSAVSANLLPLIVELRKALSKYKFYSKFTKKSNLDVSTKFLGNLKVQNNRLVLI